MIRRWFLAVPPILRVFLYSAVLAGAMIAIVMQVQGFQPYPSLQIPPLIMFLGIAAAETITVPRIQSGGGVRFALSEIPICVALWALNPVVGVLAYGGGVLVGQLPHKPLYAYKSTFNVIKSMLYVAFAYWVFHLLADPLHPFNLQTILAGFIAVQSQILTDPLIVTARSIYAGQWQFFRGNYILFDSALYGVEASIGILILVIYSMNPWLLLLLCAPLAIIWFLHRAYYAATEQTEQLQRLYETSRKLLRANTLDEAAAVILQSCQPLFHSEDVEFLVMDQDNSARTFTIAAGANEVMDGNRTVSTTEGTLLAQLVETGASVLSRRSRDPNVTAMREIWGEECAIGAITTGGVATGYLRLAPRLQLHRGFRPGEVNTLRTLAANISAVLERGQLVTVVQTMEVAQASLKHRADHDALTGLANTKHFSERVAKALADTSKTGLVAIAYLDLDDFKPINDRYGHSAGNVVLIATAERLRAAMRGDDIAARLGGDEFAALLVEMPSEAKALQACERITASLRQPIENGDQPLKVGVSLGLALAGRGKSTVEELMAKADAEMYRSKRAKKSPAHLRVVNED